MYAHAGSLALQETAQAIDNAKCSDAPNKDVAPKALQQVIAVLAPGSPQAASGVCNVRIELNVIRGWPGETVLFARPLHTMNSLPMRRCFL